MKNLYDLYTKSAKPWPLWAAPIALFLAVACWYALKKLENEFPMWVFLAFSFIIFSGSLIKSVYYGLIKSHANASDKSSPESTNP